MLRALRAPHPIVPLPPYLMLSYAGPPAARRVLKRRVVPRPPPLLRLGGACVEKRELSSESVRPAGPTTHPGLKRELQSGRVASQPNT